MQSCMWPEIQTYNLVLHLKQLNYSRVRTKYTYFSLVSRERSSTGTNNCFVVLLVLVLVLVVGILVL
jgi:hypothetical protein